MLRSTSDDPKLFGVAFVHEQLRNFVSVLINADQSEKKVRLVVDGVPSELDAYVTSAHTPLGLQRSRVTRDAVTLPPRSIMTIVSGSYLDQPSAPHAP